MAPMIHLKPETALNKAKDLIKVGKKANALEVLYEMMRSRRTRFWQQILEDIMILFVDLCVELKKNLHFRKVIHQYKVIAIQDCPQSLETVLRHYLGKITSITEEAHNESQNTIFDIEDLEALDTPESLMLNAVNQEDAQDRSNRMILMPWLRFLWDSYKNVLDLLKSIAKFENYYHEVAHDAFAFCIKYQRRNEFKKLAETLRNHAIRNNQMHPSLGGISMNNNETITLHFRTRLRQLDSAMELVMYNDAFRTVEDIYSLIMSNKNNKAKPLIMSDFYSYYTKTAELFLKAGCYLFHAAALLKVFNFHLDHKKNPNPDEIRPLACRVICAILAIPLPHERMHYDKFPISGESNNSKMRILSNILELQKTPTKASLVNDLPKSLIALLPVELKSLLNIFEFDFKPLELYSAAKPKLDYIQENEELKVYYDPLLEVCAGKTIIQVSQVYQCIKFNSLANLCPFINNIRLERLLVELIHNLELPIRIDHRTNVIHFEVHTDLGISQHKYGPLASSNSNNSSNSSTDQLSRHLKIFSNVLKSVTEMIDEANGVKVEPEQSEIRSYLINDCARSVRKLRDNFNHRRQLINNLRENTEKDLSTRKKMMDEMEAKRIEEMRKQAEDEERRLQKEAHEREKVRAEEDEKYLKKRFHMTAIKNFIKENGPINIKLDEENLDVDLKDAIDKKWIEKQKKLRENNEKSVNRFIQLDHLTRAMRWSEVPKLINQSELETEEHKKLSEEYLKERIELSKAEHAKSLKDRDRLKRMATYVAAYTETLKEKANTKYEEDVKAWQEKVKEVTKIVAEAKIKSDEYLEEKRIEQEEINRQNAIKEQSARIAAEVSNSQGGRSGFSRSMAEAGPPSFARRNESGVGFNREAGSGFNREAGSGFNREAGSGFNRESGLGFNRESGLGFNRDGGSGFNRDGGSGFNRDGGSGFNRDGGSGFNRDGGSGFNREPAANRDPQSMASGFVRGSELSKKDDSSSAGLFRPSNRPIFRENPTDAVDKMNNGASSGLGGAAGGGGGGGGGNTGAFVPPFRRTMTNTNDQAPSTQSWARNSAKPEAEAKPFRPSSFKLNTPAAPTGGEWKTAGKK